MILFCSLNWIPVFIRTHFNYFWRPTALSSTIWSCNSLAEIQHIEGACISYKHILTCVQCNTEFWGLPQEITIFKAIFSSWRLWAYRWQPPPLKTEKWWLHLRTNSGQRKEILNIQNVWDVWIAYDWSIQTAQRQQLGQQIFELHDFLIYFFLNWRSSTF